MAGMGDEANGNLMVLPSPSPVVAVAISGKKNSKYIIRWSLEKFLPEGIINFKLLHIIPRITSVPTPSKPCASNLFVKRGNVFLLFYVERKVAIG